MNFDKLGFWRFDVAPEIDPKALWRHHASSAAADEEERRDATSDVTFLRDPGVAGSELPGNEESENAWEKNQRTFNWAQSIANA